MNYELGKKSLALYPLDLTNKNQSNREKQINNYYRNKERFGNNRVQVCSIL